MVGGTHKRAFGRDGSERSVERRTEQHHIKGRACGGPRDLINLVDRGGLRCAIIVWRPGACHCVEQHGDGLGIQASILDVLQALWGCDLEKRCSHDLSDVR